MLRGYRAALAAAMLVFAAPAFAEPSDVSSSGTGFFVNTDGWLVTNAHVLEGCATASVPGIGEATDWKTDKQNDLAVVRIRGAKPAATIGLRRSAPRLGEDVAAFGYPLADVLSDSVKVTTGNINSLTGMESDTRFLQISTPIQPGNSGGPLVDQSGLLLGVTTAQLGATYAGATGVLPQNVNFALRAHVVELFLQSRDIAVETSEAIGPALSTADLADKVAPAVVQVLCHGRPPATETAEAPASAASPTQPTAVPQRVFQSLDNHDAVGFDYQSLNSVSQAECRSACQSDSICRAFTYNKRERFCFLKTGAAILVANGDAATAVAGELASDVVISTFMIAAGRDMAGGDYQRLRNSSFVGCYLACEKDSQCRAFAFVRKQKSCWLKNSIGPQSAKKGVDLGMR